jgi:uncharacterized membrane protein
MNASDTMVMKVVLLGVLNAALVAAGVSLQKLNALRSGNLVLSGWIVAAAACMAPTFFIGNLALSIGGRMSVFVPVTALVHLFVLAVAKYAFDEPVGYSQLLGTSLIVAGVYFCTR